MFLCKNIVFSLLSFIKMHSLSHCAIPRVVAHSIVISTVAKRSGEIYSEKSSLLPFEHL